MVLPDSLYQIGVFGVLLSAAGLLWWKRINQPKRINGGPIENSMGLVYEWSSTSFEKANEKLLSSFPELNFVLENMVAKDLYLVRFGLFNLAKETINSEEISQPVKIHFNPKTIIVSALFGEALKMANTNFSQPVVSHGYIQLPKETILPQSTLIYNFVLRCGKGPENVTGGTIDCTAIKRVG